MDRSVITRYFSALAVVILLLAGVALGQETVVSGSVISVTDGDTIKVLVAGNQLLKIRLLNIDAPEHNQAYGPESTAYLSQLVLGRDVELHTRGLDRYGRTLADVMLDGVDIDLEQVRAGMAWVYEKYIGQVDENTQANYHAAQVAAQQERRGLWSDPAPMEPWLFRHFIKQ